MPRTRCYVGGAQRCLAIPSWATADPSKMSAADPAIGMNLVGGVWKSGDSYSKGLLELQDPLSGGTMMKVPNPTETEVDDYITRMKDCPRSGLHNPIKNPERYTMLGDVMAKGAKELRKPEVRPPRRSTAPAASRTRAGRAHPR